LMPVVGMPLPLVSYGGSSVITSMVGFGILLNISMRKFSTG
jgi:rod shape determining protein RodA